MPDGKLGDHPITDIIVHERLVYSERADELIRRIVEMGGSARIDQMLLTDYNYYSDPDVPELEIVLKNIYDELVKKHLGE
jgi:hypothetical protein